MGRHALPPGPRDPASPPPAGRVRVDPRLALLGLPLLVAGLVVVVVQVGRDDAAETAAAGEGAGGDCAAPGPLVVSAPAEDAELVQALAAGWSGSGDPRACIPVEVTVGPGGDGAPPALVVRRVPEVSGSPVVGATGDPVVVASTVAVVATDPATAASLGWPEAAPAPGAIASTLVTGAGEGPRGIGLADPRSSVSALLGVTALATAPLGVPLPDVPGSGTSDPAVQGALFALFNAVTLEAADQPQLLAAAADRPVRALLVDEAAVARANAGDRAEPLAAVYPAGAATLVEVTATVVDRGDDPALVEAADALARFAASEAGRAVAVERGYRGPDGTLPGPVATALAAAGGGSGIAGQDDPVAAPSAELLATMTFGWNGASNPGRYILVVDVSGSMAEEVPGTGRTKLEFAQAAAVEAVRQAPRSGEIGLWEFSTAVAGDTDHRELVPNGPIGDVLDTRTRREALVAAVEGLVAREDTGLYDTALAAFRRAQEQYQEGEPNLVVLVTDGRNEDTTGGIDRDTLLRTLTEEQDPARPVGITTIAYGADADVESLALVSEATGGLAYVSPNPAQIGQILVAAFSGGRAGLLPGDATAPAVPGD